MVSANNPVYLHPPSSSDRFLPTNVGSVCSLNIYINIMLLLLLLLLVVVVVVVVVVAVVVGGVGRSKNSRPT